MRQSRKVIMRILCVLGVLASGLTAAATSAGAAVPNRWGFAYVDVPNGVPNLAHQAGSWPPGPTVSVLTPVGGPTYVRFPQLAVAGGVVHVTAVSPSPRWCQVLKWGPSGPDLLVAVRCYQYGGAPVTVPFTVLFEESTGLLPAPKAFGYVHYNGAAIATQFNSAGVANTVVAGPPGVWTVSLPGLGSAGRAGGLQVTAVNPTQPARCKVAAWASAPAGQTVRVRCHNATNIPLNTGWTLTYQRERAITGAALPPKNFAYTFDNTPANAGPYSPVPPAVNYNSQGALNTVQSAGVGLRLVTFPQVGVLPDHVQVTAYGPGPEYCNLLTLWFTGALTATVRDVACYNGLVRANRPSLTTYTSAF
ncbi:hypothetical protein AB0395_09705 [Streptosporangium sp. NPDC051023]|uniref:hypothetical protein n=1 Tax=Streptosporangium sp. NPDC051023 TaxID=3155410 RepID=UPI00344D51CE